MSKKMPKNTELQVSDRNKELFELYAFWRSLPIPILSQMTEQQLINRMGFDDPVVLGLVTIKTQTEFSQKYKIHIDTLSDWNKKIRDRDPLFESKSWARTLTKNVMLAIYNHGIRKGNPAMLKLWMQVVNDWEEKSSVKISSGNVKFVFTEIDDKKAAEMKKPLKSSKENE